MHMPFAQKSIVPAGTLSSMLIHFFMVFRPTRESTFAVTGRQILSVTGSMQYPVKQSETVSDEYTSAATHNYSMRNKNIFYFIFVHLFVIITFKVVVFEGYDTLKF